VKNIAQLIQINGSNENKEIKVNFALHFGWNCARNVTTKHQRPKTPTAKNTNGQNSAPAASLAERAPRPSFPVIFRSPETPEGENKGRVGREITVTFSEITVTFSEITVTFSEITVTFSESTVTFLPITFL
jgi:hypothetical protein